MKKRFDSMSKIDKLIKKLLSGDSDNNFDFDDLRKVIEHYGFKEEIRGSHHLYRIKVIMHLLIFNN